MKTLLKRALAWLLSSRLALYLVLFAVAVVVEHFAVLLREFAAGQLLRMWGGDDEDDDDEDDPPSA